MAEIDLSGIWISRYEYGDDQQGVHRVEVRQEGSEIKGVSLPDESGSRLGLDLQLDRARRILTGIWTESTSPTGEYRGQFFRGGLQLILNAEANKASGKWVGHNRDYTKINTGDWTLEKESGENT